MASERSGPDRALLIVLTVVAALVVVAVVIVLTRGEPELRDEGTPEGVVQRYTRAVLADEPLSAERYLSTGALARCDSHIPIETEDVRLTLVSTDERGGNATVRVTITVSYDDPPFGIDQSTSDAVFQLVEEEDEWRIDTVPWQLETCISRDTP